MKHVSYALVILCCLGSTALAQTPPESFAAQGAAAYQSEDYDTALVNFLKSYEADEDPSMAYNLARTYEAKKDYPNAEKYYRIFVESPDVNVDAREDAFKRMKLMRQLVEVNKAEQSTPPAPKAQPATPPSEVTPQP